MSLINKNYSLSTIYYTKQSSKTILLLSELLLDFDLIYKKYQIDNIDNIDNTSSDTNIDNIEKATDYDCLLKIVMSPKVIKCTKNLITYLNKLSGLIFDSYSNNKDDKINNDNLLYLDPSKDSRKLLMALIISFFPEMVLTNTVMYKDKMYLKASGCVKKLNAIFNRQYINSVPALIDLHLIILNYVNVYNIWQHNDRLYIVYNTALTYLDLCNPDKQINDYIFRSCAQQEKRRLINTIKYLNHSPSLELFNLLTSSSSNEYLIIKELYWLRVAYYLYKEPPDKSVVLKMFLKAKELIKSLISNRKDVCEQIDDVIDDTIMRNVLSEDDIDFTFFLGKCNYILEWIEKLQSPDDDVKLDYFRIELKNKIDNKEEFGGLIPFFFKFVLDQLENIQKQKYDYLEFIHKQNN